MLLPSLYLEEKYHEPLMPSRQRQSLETDFRTKISLRGKNKKEKKPTQTETITNHISHFSLKQYIF